MQSTYHREQRVCAFLYIVWAGCWIAELPHVERYGIQHKYVLL